MEALVGTIIGALIAGLAMILNSYFSARRQERREDHLAKLNRLDADVQELGNLYTNALQILDRLIRKRGLDNENKLETLYDIEIQLQLIGTSEIYGKFGEVKSGITKMAHQLPSYPDEFIPKFEDDDVRYARLEARKKVERDREVKVLDYLPAINKERNELSELMKADLAGRKNLES